MAADKRIVLVFGGCGALGTAFIRTSVACTGIQLVVVDRKETRLAELKKKYGVECVTANAEKLDEVQRVFDSYASTGGGATAGGGAKVGGGGRLYGVVNLVGDYHPEGLEETTPADLDGILKENLLTSFNILKCATKALAQEGGGSIVCCSASCCHMGIRDHEAWTAAKAAVEGLHRSAAATYVRQGIRINCVAPGLMLSPEVSANPPSAAAAGSHADMIGVGRHTLAEKSAKIYPMRRIAEPREVAAAIEWLLHPDSSYVTGEVLPVDGGLSTLTPHMVHQEMVTLAMEPEPRSLKGPPVSGAPDSQQQQEQPRGKAVAAT